MKISVEELKEIELVIKLNSRGFDYEKISRLLNISEAKSLAIIDWYKLNWNDFSVEE